MINQTMVTTTSQCIKFTSCPTC